MGDTTQVHHVLLVEDHLADVKLTQRAFQGFADTQLHTAIDGIEAMDFLLQRGLFSDKPRPDIVLLDLNMPRKDGWEVLQEMRSSENLSEIPVVILTTSAEVTDVERAFRLHANSYVVKPVSFDHFRASIEAIHQYWFEVSLVP